MRIHVSTNPSFQNTLHIYIANVYSHDMIELTSPKFVKQFSYFVSNENYEFPWLHNFVNVWNVMRTEIQNSQAVEKK